MHGTWSKSGEIKQPKLKVVDPSRDDRFNPIKNALISSFPNYFDTADNSRNP